MNEQKSFSIMKHLFIFARSRSNRMDKLFDIVFLDETFEFLSKLEKKHYEKILFTIRKAQTRHDPELFKKLKDEIWEFRTLYQGLHYRLFAFWDKTNSRNTLVISTHGIVKKTARTTDSEIQKAKQVRLRYFEDKEIMNKNKK